MYDIEFFLPVTSQGQWGERLKEISKTLIHDPGDRKICVTLLTGLAEKEMDEEELVIGWDERLEVRTINTPFDLACQKIFYYYTEIALDRANDVKWFARIDDDSFTSANGLIQVLDNEYDWQKPQHIGIHLKSDWHPVDRMLMERMGYGHLYKNLPGHFDDIAPVHEHETGITSAEAMKIVMNDPHAQRLLKFRMTIADGWGDHCFALAAKMCGILPYLARVGNTEGVWQKYVKLNGSYLHVHPIHESVVGKENWEVIKEILVTQPNQELSGDYEFINHASGKQGYYQLQENGRIINLANNPIGRWTQNDDCLHIFSDLPHGLQELETSSLIYRNGSWQSTTMNLKSNEKLT